MKVIVYEKKDNLTDVHIYEDVWELHDNKTGDLVIKFHDHSLVRFPEKNLSDVEVIFNG